MSDEVKDPKIVEMEKKFNQFYFYGETIHFDKVEEVGGFYVASMYRESVNDYAVGDAEGKPIIKDSLYFVYPKNKEGTKGAVLKISSHPKYEFDIDKSYINSASENTELDLDIEGKHICRFEKPINIDIKDMEQVGLFLESVEDRKQASAARKFLTNFITDEETLDRGVIERRNQERLEKQEMRGKKIKDLLALVGDKPKEILETIKISKMLKYYCSKRAGRK